MYSLKKKHEHELEIDVADLIAPRYGTAIHDSFEKVDIPGSTQEKRMSMKVEVDGKEYVITGKPDIILNNKMVVDIKSTSVWTYIYGSKDEEYIIQESIYKLLAKENGFKVVDEGEICYCFTDWSPKKAKEDREYPQSRIRTKKIKLWKDEQVIEYIKGRLKLFAKAEISLPECTDEDLWRTKDTFAVMKKNRKQAIKVCNSEKEAVNYLATNDLMGNKDYYVQERKGIVKRCKYCSASKFCEQYWGLKAAGVIDDG
jgi:hypothetical protein